MTKETATAFDGRKAYDHLKVLAVDIGPRHGSSKNELKAARYIHGYFRTLGLATAYDEYPIYSFEDAQATLSDPDGRTFPCKPFPMTKNTPAAGITCEVVILEDAKAVFLDERITGKIVVTFNTFSGDDDELFVKFKPAGLVSVQAAPDKLLVAEPHRYSPRKPVPTVPSVCLTYADGIELMRDKPALLTLHSKTVGEGWRIGKNVIADLPGNGISDDVVIVCAHYDSVWTGPGAFDNGGGTAAIMELARVYKRNGSKYNLRFCAFGGEEMGLWGSKSYVKSLKDAHDAADLKRKTTRNPQRTELERIRFVINLDMMGMHMGASNALILGHPDIAASVRLLANQRRYAIALQEDKVYSSDNWHFNMLGIPSLSFTRMGFAKGNGHTAGDTIDNCSPEGIAHIANFAKAWCDRYLMESHVFPFPRALPPTSRKSVDAILDGKKPFELYDRNDYVKQAKKRG